MCPSKGDVKNYRRYLRSREWRKKKVIFMRYFKRCALCGTRQNRVIHHKHYDTIFQETHEDVMCLCETCHRAIHYKNGDMRRRRPAKQATEYFYRLTENRGMKPQMRRVVKRARKKERTEIEEMLGIECLAK